MDDEAREHARVRLGFLDALVTAQERRDEVLGVVDDAEDTEQAAQSLVTLLELPDESHARLILDMQVRRWTRQERQNIRRERDDLRASLIAD